MYSSIVYDSVGKVSVNDVTLPVLADDGSNRSMFYAVSDLTKDGFARNFGGYPRSDIAIINEQQNISVARAMLENLPDYHSADSPNIGSDVDIMNSVRSKYMQSPSEILPFIEKEIEKRDVRILKEREAAAASVASAASVVSNSDVTDKNIDGL